MTELVLHDGSRRGLAARLREDPADVGGIKDD